MVLTLGDTWAQLFEESLSRQMAGIVHLQAGSPRFQVTEAMIHHINVPNGPDSFLQRLNSKSTQASELVWKFKQLVQLSDLTFIDTQLLDTAIGQYVLSCAQSLKRTVWAVGVDDKLSPLAPAFLQGVIYPRTPDDLVKLSLSEKV